MCKLLYYFAVFVYQRKGMGLVLTHNLMRGQKMDENEKKSIINESTIFSKKVHLVQVKFFLVLDIRLF